MEARGHLSAFRAELGGIWAGEEPEIWVRVISRRAGGCDLALAESRGKPISGPRPAPPAPEEDFAQVPNKGPEASAILRIVRKSSRAAPPGTRSDGIARVGPRRAG